MTIWLLYFRGCVQKNNNRKTTVNIARRQESVKTIVIIELTTLGLCKVQNFVKIGRFVVFGPKLWPKRWQVPISTGVNIDRRQESQKNLSPLNSGPSIYVDFQISSKLRCMQLLLKTIVTIEFTTCHNYGLEDHRCQYW